MRFLVLKAIIRGQNSTPLLFDKQVDVGGFTRKDGTYVPPHRATRKVLLDNVAAAPKPVAPIGDLFAPRATMAPPAPPSEPPATTAPSVQTDVQPPSQTAAQKEAVDPTPTDAPLVPIRDWGAPKGTKPAQRKRWNKDALAILAAKTDEEMTEEDRDVLARYTGRGGIGDSLNEFYTRPDVAGAMWEMLRNLGFAGGEVLEPSCGTGVFLHTAPADARVVGVEMDPTSSRIARILHPTHEVQPASLERFATLDGRQFDAVIGNPPFGLRGSTIAFDKSDIPYAESYFLAAALDKVRDGSLVAMIVPTGVMDSPSRRALRQDLMCQAELVTAHRLPNTAFAEAHTEVTSDIVVFRKRPQTIAGALGALTQDQLRAVGVWDEDFLAGTYFTEGRGAGQILGRLEDGWRAKAGIGNDITVTGSMDGVADALRAWRTPSGPGPAPSPSMADIMAAVGPDESDRARVLSASERPPYIRAELGDIRVIDGIRYILQGEPPRWHTLEQAEAESVLAALPIAEQLDDLMAGRVKDPALARATLAEALDEYVRDHGVPSVNRDLAAWLVAPTLPRDGDPHDHARRVDDARRRVAALLGAVSRDGSYSDLVTGRTREGEALDFDTIATQLSLEGGGFTVAQLARATGKPEAEVLDHLFASPSYAIDAEGEFWSTMDDYLTGELWPKYDVALARAAHGGLSPEYRAKYAAQAEALEATIAPQALEDVEVSLRSGFMSPRILEAYFADRDRRYRDEHPGSSWSPGTYKIEHEDGVWSFTSRVGTGLDHTALLAEKFLNRDGVRKDDMPKIQELERDLKEWALRSEHRDEIETAYNRSYRGFRARAFSDAPLVVPGLNPALDVNRYHWSSIRWALETGKGIIAADVGLGKTGRGLMLARLAKASGRSKRPAFVVPKSVIANWVASAEFWFPGSKVLVIGETTTTDAKGKTRTTSDNEAVRRRKYQEMRQNDYDFVFISQPAWNDLDVSAELRERYTDDDFWVKRAEALGKGPTAKKLAEEKTRHDQSTAKRQFQSREETVTFDDLGIDMLVMDEAHAFKNLVAARQRFGQSPKFLGGSGESKRALDTQYKTRLLREQNGGRGVYFLTATPTKNSPLEVYSMLSHIAPEAFERMGILNAEDFLDRFCEFKNDLILTVSGKLEEALVTAGFKNLDELRGVMRRFIERTTAEEVGLQLPARDDRQHLVDMTPEQEAVYQELREQAAEAGKSDATGEAHIFSIMDRMGKASMDLGLLGMRSGRSPKIEACAENVRRLLPEGKQIVFCDSVPMHERIVQELVKQGIPREQIAVVNAEVAKTGAARQKISDDFNAGKLQVVVGNTATMGEGVNLQIGTSDIHHLDLPWEPASVQQRNGRGLRQGNKLEALRVHTYLAKGSFDGYRWQTLVSKKDWQDLLWNGGDRIENLAREGALSREDMLIMLAPNPEAARAAYEADKSAAVARHVESERQKAIQTFERYNRMLGSLTEMRQRGDESATRRRLEAKVHDLKAALIVSEHFPHKEVLDADTPVLIQPTTGDVWRAGKAARLLTHRGPEDWVVVGVDPDKSTVQMRPVGEVGRGPKSVALDQLARGAEPIPYDADEEMRQFEQSLSAVQTAARMAGQKAVGPMTYDRIRALPADLVARNRHHIERHLRSAIQRYEEKGHAFPVLENGTPKLVDSYTTRDKNLQLILPDEEGRGHLIAGHAGAEASKKIENHYGGASAYSRYGTSNRPDGLTATYRIGNRTHATNLWGAISKHVLGKNIGAEGRAAAQQVAHAAIAEAPSMATAFKAATPALHIDGFAADATAIWPKATVGALRRRAEQLGALGLPLHSVLGSDGHIAVPRLRMVRSHDHSDETVGDYLDALAKRDA